MCRMRYEENKDVNNKVWPSAVCWIIPFAPLSPLSTFICSAIPWEIKFLSVYHWAPLPTDLQLGLANVALQQKKEEREAVKSVAFISVAVGLLWTDFAQGQGSCGKVHITQPPLSPDSPPLSTPSDLWWQLDPIVEKAMAAHSSVLAWRIPWTEEPGGLPSMGSHRVRHDWSDLAEADPTAL